jgi:hypothetical protein
MANGFEDPDNSTSSSGDSASSSGLITSSTPIPDLVYNSGAGVQSVASAQPTVATESLLIQDYNNMSEALRKGLAQKLKSAGYKVPVTGKYNTAVREAFLQVSRDLSDEIRNLQRNDPARLKSTKYDFDTLINDRIGERQAGFADQYKPTRTINVSPATVAEGKINDTFRKFLGRDATPNEIINLTDLLNKAEQKNPDISTPKLIGGSVVYTNTGGLDRDTFLENLVKKVKDPKTGKLEFETKRSEEESLSTQDLQSVARSNGVTLSPEEIQQYNLDIRNGKDIKVIKNQIRSVAGLGRPDNIKKLLAEGTDLNTIYSPYKRTMAALLELDPESIDINDTTLQSAIGDRELPIYEFRKILKKDPRWQYTNNAREEVSNKVLRVLRDFGFQG